MQKENHEISIAHYALLGEFTVEYEWFCFFLRNTIRHLAGSVSDENEMIITALTTEMNAMPLLKAYQSIAMNMRALTDDEKVLLSKIYKQAKDLIEHRNKLIHGRWFALPPMEGGKTQARVSGVKDTHTKTGVNQRYFVLSLEELQPLIDECKNLCAVISILALAFFESDLMPYFMNNTNGSISINPDRPKMKPDLSAEEASVQQSGAPTEPPVVT